MMAFSGPSVHRCKCFGEDDERGGAWYPCPPDLCEAEGLLDALIEEKARADRYEKALGWIDGEYGWLADDETGEVEPGDAFRAVREIVTAARAALAEEDA